MTVVSKAQFDETICGLGCAEVMHPWHPHCIPAIWMMLKSTVIGYNKFALGIYLLSILLKWNKLTKEELKSWTQSYWRTGMAALWMASTFIGSNCILRSLFKFNYYTTVSVPAFIAGLGIFFESKSRTEVILYTFVNMLFETAFKHLEFHQILKVTPLKGTVLFMFVNAMFMYEIRRWKRTKGTKPVFYWFFSPPSVHQKINNNNNNFGEMKPWFGPPCPHEGPCLDDIRKSSFKYLSIGYIFGAAKMIVPNLSSLLKKPRTIFMYLVDKRAISFGLFAGLYVALYKISSCILCQSLKKDSEEFAIPCGSAAGLAFCMLPGTSVLAAILANLLIILVKGSRLSKTNLPMMQLCFALVNAILFHNYAFYNNLSPRFFSNMVNVATNDRCFQIYQNFSGLAHKTSTH